MISAERRAEIRRLFYAEHWRVGTIATALGVHHETVEAAIEAERFRPASGVVRPSALDPYVGFIRETLERHPRLRASRLYEMIRQRGYGGRSAAQLRRLVRRLRPRPAAEAYLQTLPAEQAQVDWGSFGSMRVGMGARLVSCFVMVLSWSRALFALFTLDQTMESFLRGHVEAFAYFGGVPRAILYDNLKSAVLERHGDAIRFHPRLLELCGHYHFAPRPCAPGRGNEKGRVERAIGYLRTAFFAARSFADLDDLNAQFRRWRDEVAHVRPVPGGERQTVAAALEHERRLLLPLPANELSTELLKTVSSGKTPYVRFDRNRYSIPHDHVRRPLTLMASPTCVRLLDGEREVARHARTYDSNVTVEQPEHIAALVAAKRAAQPLTGRSRLFAAVPEAQAFVTALAERGEHLGYHVARLLRLLDGYGAPELVVALGMATKRQAFSAGSVAHILEQRRRAQGLQPPLAVILPDDPRVRDLRVTPHNLEDYDAIATPSNKR